jgi:hypothetical protein
MAIRLISTPASAEGISDALVTQSAPRRGKPAAGANAATGGTASAARRNSRAVGDDQQAAILLDRIRSRGEKLSARIGSLLTKLG